MHRPEAEIRAEIERDKKQLETSTAKIALLKSIEIKTIELLGTIAYESGISIDRLSEICNAEREGRCMVLPCKIGDTIYIIPSEVNRRINKAINKQMDNRIYKQVVDGIRLFRPGKWCISTCDGLELHRSESFGKTVFLTHEAATAALQEGEI